MIILEIFTSIHIFLKSATKNIHNVNISILTHRDQFLSNL